MMHCVNTYKILSVSGWEFWKMRNFFYSWAWWLFPLRPMVKQFFQIVYNQWMCWDITVVVHVHIRFSTGGQTVASLPQYMPRPLVEASSTTVQVTLMTEPRLNHSFRLAGVCEWYYNAIYSFLSRVILCIIATYSFFFRTCSTWGNHWQRASIKLTPREALESEWKWTCTHCLC